MSAELSMGYDMRMEVKIALGVLSGLITGAGIGSGITYFVMKERNIRQIDKECEDLREFYEEKLAGYSKKEPSIIEEAEVKETTPHISTRDYDEVKGHESFTDYTNSYMSNEKHVSDISKMKDDLDRLNKEIHDDDLDKHMADREYPEDDISDDESEDEAAYRESESENDERAAERENAIREGRAPYFIELSEYVNSKQWYNKITWDYYEEDADFVDERGNIVSDEDRDTYIPENFELYVTEHPDEGDVIRFRNDIRETDVEVCITSGHYEVPPENHGPTVTYIS